MNQNKTKLKDESGLTLVELIIAIAVIAIICVSYAMSNTTSLFVSAETRQKYTALNLARQEIELYKKYDMSKTIDRNSPDWGFPKVQTTPATNGVIYTINSFLIPTSEWTTEVTNDPKITPIRVTVSWASKGVNRTVALDTYVIAE